MTGTEIRQRGRTMSDQALRSMSYTLWDTDLVGCRMVLALAEILWSVMLFWPGNTFDRPTYSHMAQIMSEDAWAFVFAMSGITQITIVLMEDFHSRFARYFAAWNSTLWSFVVISMLLSVYPPPAAIGGEIALAMVAFWIWVRPFLLAEGIRNARERQ